MPIIDLKKVNKTIQEIKKSFEGLNREECNEVDFWYQKFRRAMVIANIKRGIKNAD